MTAPNVLPGSKFRLYRGNDATPQQFLFSCLVSTLTFRRNNEYEDVTVPDCDDPNKTPWRKSQQRSKSWDASVSGIVDVSRFSDLRDDAESDSPRNYQIMLGESGAGAGTYTGPVWIENLEITKQDNGLVRFTANLRGDGEVLWVDAA